MGLSNFFSTGGSKTKSTSYIREQKDALQDALALYSPQLGVNENVWQGPRVAPLTDVQRGVLQSAPSFLQTFGQPQQAGMPLFDETGKTLTGLLNQETGASLITPEQTEKYYRESIYDPTVRAFEEHTLPSIDESYAGGNFFGSARGKARQRAAENLGRYLGEARSGLEWDVLGRNQALQEARAGRAQQAVNQGMQYSMMPAQNTINNLRIAAGQVEGMANLFGIGQAEQTQEQREIEAAVAKFAEDNQLTDPTNLAILMSLIGQTMARSTGETRGAQFGSTLLNAANQAAWNVAQYGGQRGFDTLHSWSSPQGMTTMFGSGG